MDISWGENILNTGLTKNTTKSLKGYFALAVLIHHLYQHSGIFHGSYIGVCLQLLGFYSVSLFFFLSGYGLFASYRKNPDEYIGRFPKERIFPYYCDCLLFVVLYAFFQSGINRSVTFGDILLSLSFGKTVIINGWYLQVALLLYVFFFGVFYCIKRQRCAETRGIAFMWGIVLLYYILAHWYGMGYTWYVTVFSFPLGLTVARNEERINKIILKHPIKILFWGMSVFCLLTVVSFLYNGYSFLMYVFQSIPFVLFAGVIYGICVLLSSTPAAWLVDNSIARSMGHVSLEIYVCQGFFLTLFHYASFNVSNPYWYCVSVISCTIGFAIGMSKLRRIIHKKIAQYI